MSRYALPELYGPPDGQALKFREVQQALEELMSMLRQMGMNKQRVEQMRKMMEANQQALKEQLRSMSGSASPRI